MGKDIITRFKKFLSKEFKLEHFVGNNNLNLGCGNKYIDGFINIDYYNTSCADLIYDLDKGIPYDNESMDIIFSDNFMEHLTDFVGMVKECHRVLKKDGYLIIKVPYFKSKHAFIDPTHKVFFTIQSMDYYVR